MKTKTILKLSLVLAALACSSQTKATSIFYHFDVDVSALAGNPNAPFALDFQMTDGDGINNSFASIGNFNFSGVGAPILIGGASGSLSSSVSLTDTEFYNDLFQEFSSGAILSFDVQLSSNASGITPDAFALGIGDAAGGGFNYFNIFTQIDLRNGQQELNTFSPLDGVVTSVRVPESASPANLPIGLATLGVIGLLTRNRNKAIA